MQWTFHTQYWFFGWYDGLENDELMLMGQKMQTKIPLQTTPPRELYVTFPSKDKQQWIPAQPFSIWTISATAVYLHFLSILEIRNKHLYSGHNSTGLSSSMNSFTTILEAILHSKMVTKSCNFIGWYVHQKSTIAANGGEFANRSQKKQWHVWYFPRNLICGQVKWVSHQNSHTWRKCWLPRESFISAWDLS